MVDITALKAANAKRWANAKLTRSFAATAERLVAPQAKAKFMALSAATKVPWFVIAVIKQRECGDDPTWLGNISNGQRWNRKTTIVPIGRGPFSDWQSAGLDALARCAPYAARWTDWSAGGALTLLEQYNGLGYAARGVASPYIWSGTDQYRAGKYIRDHVYDPNTIDVQLGCAGLILAMAAIDSSVQFGAAASNLVPFVRKTAQPLVAPHPASVPQGPSITSPAPGSLGAWVASFFKKAA